MTPSSPQTASETFSGPAFSAKEIVEALSPEVIGTPGSSSGSIATDTRSLRPGQWYLALKGETQDGHRFLSAAITAGAAGCIVSEVPANLPPSHSGVIFKVPDTLDAYHRLASQWLRQVNPFVIAVTGSSGKTTTKEMCAAVVSSMPSHKSRANENNEFGVPKTILSMPPGTRVLVVEMAMRGLGQIAQLAGTAKPDVGIITCVGTAHIELLGSLENIIKAKCELLEHLKENGIAVIGNPTPALIDRVKNVFPGKLALYSDDDVSENDVNVARTRFSVKGFSNEFEVHAHGLQHMEDAWCAVIAGRAAGLSDADIAEGLKSYQSVEGRGNRITLPTGAVVVDESYNANPDSLRCAVEALLDERAFPQPRKTIVLGEMAELGDKSDQLHKQTGEWLRSKRFETLITVGPKARLIADGARGGLFTIVVCNDQNEAKERLKKDLSVERCIMIKGSHCANLDKLVRELVHNE